MPIYDISVKLTGEDGNAFSILGSVKRAMLAAEAPLFEVNQFIEEATSGDYNHLLATVAKWVNIE